MAINPSNERPGRERLRKLAQAAMNADQTVDQVEEILGGVGPLLLGLADTTEGLNGAIDKLEGTLVRINASLDGVDDALVRMTRVVGRMERIVDQVEVLVGIAGTAMKPVELIESAGRGVAGIFGLGAKDRDVPSPRSPKSD